jgi:acetoin:2,6-dichlorophenolindophenol oxidoreductase subunit alpha
MKLHRALLKKMYRCMVRIRLCEESLVAPILAGEIKTPCHLYSGQEAIATGVCLNLDEKDLIFGNHRSHGHFLAKGGDIRKLIAEVFTRETGCSRGRGGSMHLVDPEKGIMGTAPIVSGTISLAVGAALALSNQSDNQVSVSFFGDGAAGEGVLYESLNFASLNKLPVVFICENNFYSTHMPIRETRVESNVYLVAKPFCIKSFQVDGNDVLSVYQTAKKAVEQCRRGNGPVFIECLTYRMRGHVGPDDNVHGIHTDIRPKEEIDNWRTKDPIKRLEQYLIKNELFEKDELEAIVKFAEEEVLAAHAFAAGSSSPKQKGVGYYVFA